VMHVPVHDEYAVDAQVLFQQLGHNRHRVEVAETALKKKIIN
jgi:hypothetical protein